MDQGRRFFCLFLFFSSHPLLLVLLSFGVWNSKEVPLSVISFYHDLTPLSSVWKAFLPLVIITLPIFYTSLFLMAFALPISNSKMQKRAKWNGHRLTRNKNLCMRSKGLVVRDQIYYLIFIWKTTLMFFPKGNRKVQRPQWQDLPLKPR